MIPKPEDVLMADSDYQELAAKFPKLNLAIQESMKEYCRRLLDHVAEKCTVDWGNGFTLIEKDEILKIKDEL
jgi:hypothetical protein